MAIRTGLPAGDVPSLKLVPATMDQAKQCWALNGTSWKGPLSLEAYSRRELHLASQPLTQDGGTTWWILVDGNDANPDDPTILSSCETYRKTAFVARKDRPGEVEQVVSHGIGSVFCRNEFRGKGYAGRMMAELAERMRTWQQESGREALFNVLYSDIGKTFYAKRGWIPFPSSHISLKASASFVDDERLPKARPLYAEDIGPLCELDVEQLRTGMSSFTADGAQVRVAFPPETKMISWQHSREEFVGKEAYNRVPLVKGAIVESETGKRVWCIWNRVVDENPAESKLYIVRIAAAGSLDFVHGAISNGANGTHKDGYQTQALAACLRAAQLEAKEWNIDHVELWNPSSTTLEAARILQSDVEVVNREEDSIASLLWYGSEVKPEELEWVANEKFGWC